MSSSMSSLFNPRGVAVIGVSERPGSLGTSVLRNLVGTGFGGRIVAVHPRLESLDGVPCIPRIPDLPDDIDVAFLAVPAASTVAAVAELAAAGVANVIVGSSGYAEGGDEEGVARQAALTKLGERLGIRIVGPNCNGIYCATSRVSIGFNSGHERVHRAGGLAILSHSGALFDLMARRLDRLGGGLSLFVSCGNEAQVDVLDYLEFALTDPATRAIALLIDALPSAERFRSLAAQARALGKPIVALKLGRSELGGAAATAHSSRLVGNTDAYAAFFESCGIPLVRTLEGLITAGTLLERHGFRCGGMLGFSTSGAGAALMADIAERHGIALPPYPAAAIEALKQHLRYQTLLNPTDIGSLNGMAAIDDVFDQTFGDPRVGVFAAMLHTMPGRSRTLLAAAMTRAGQTFDLPLVVIGPGGLSDDARADYEAAGAMVLEETDCAFEGLTALLTPQPVMAAQRSASTPTIAALANPGMLSEPDSLALLARFGIEVAETRTVTNAVEAVSAAAQIGYPVALKGVVEGIAHKSEEGLIRLDLGDPDEVAQAFESLGCPRSIVQAMRRGDIEAMVGVSRTEDVGPVIIAGLGGVFVEALRQTVSWALPVDRTSIADKLRASALGRVLTSPRWRHENSLERVIDTVMALQDFAFAAGDRLEAAEINPLVIGAHGATAVDGLVIAAGHPLSKAA